jgi:hypothetical protein
MKKSLILLLILVCLSCTKQPIEPTDSKEVKISIDYAFPSHSGDMTPKNSSNYLSFYTKYIESRVLTPRLYIITLAKTELYYEHAYSRTYGGKWGDHTLISVPTGKYHVTGGSIPQMYSASGDTCSFRFDDTITVISATTTLTLKARYTCFLILLDTMNVKSTRFEGEIYGSIYKTTMMKTEEYYHAFIGGIPPPVSNEYYNLRLTITQKNNRETIIPLTDYTWQYGKYYYFGNTGNNYTLPPMTGI